MIIQITGASGFVGSNLTRHLSEKLYKVDNISLREDNWFKSVDLDSDVLIHLAGKAHDTSNVSGSDEYFKVNRDLTIKLFDIFLESEINDFFYFSSVKAAADSVDGVLTEDYECHPLTPYGKSKLEAEKYLLSKKLPANKRIFIIRPCMIHGPGNKGNLNLLYEIVKRGIPWPLGSFHNGRSFLGIENLNFLIEHMISTPTVKSGIYNFSDDGQISTNELVHIISDILGKNTKIWRINKKIIEKLAQVGDFLPLPLNTERLKKLTESYLVSNKKIKDALGIDNLPKSVENGLIHTIESFKSKSV